MEHVFAALLGGEAGCEVGVEYLEEAEAGGEGHLHDVVGHEEEAAFAVQLEDAVEEAGRGVVEGYEVFAALEAVVGYEEGEEVGVDGYCAVVEFFDFYLDELVSNSDPSTDITYHCRLHPPACGQPSDVPPAYSSRRSTPRRSDLCAVNKAACLSDLPLVLVATARTRWEEGSACHSHRPCQNRASSCRG